MSIHRHIYIYIYVSLSLHIYIYICIYIISSSKTLIPIPGFLPPGYSLLACVFLCYLPPGEILQSEVGILLMRPMPRTRLFMIGLSCYAFIIRMQKRT